MAALAVHAVEPTNNAPSTNATTTDADALLRSVLILQEQLKETRREVQAARDRAEAVSKETADLLNERLQLLEAKQAQAQVRQLETLQSSNHLMLQAVGIVAGLACLAVLMNGWMQLRAVSRLTRITEQLDLLPALAAPAARQLSNGNGAHAKALVEAESEGLSRSIARLQERLEHLEFGAAGAAAPEPRKELAGASASPAAIALSKGQTLLNLDKADEASACFDQAISIDAGNVEAWIKKGSALERLQRFDDAISAYDHAIAMDDSTATTYLLKAGVLNRQKRYTEALQCYEKALQVQKTRPAAAAQA